MGKVETKKSDKTLIDLLIRYLRPTKQLMIISFVLYISDLSLNLVPPVAQQVFTDNIITGKNKEWFVPFVILYTAVLIIEAIVWIALTYHRNALLGKFNIDLNSEYIWHVLRMPMNSFKKFTPGELVARRQRGQDAAFKMADNLMPMLVFFLILAIVFVIMIIYCWQLATVAILSVVLSVVSMVLTSQYQNKVARKMEGTQCKLQTTTIQSIQDMSTIKSAGAEMERYAYWQGKYTNALNSRVIANRSVVLLGLVPIAASIFGSAFILIIGCYYILQGVITPGILLAVQGFVASAVYPMLQITRTLQTLFTSQAALERIDSVLEVPCVIPNETDKVEDIKAPYKLQGKIDMNNITFGYDKSLPPLLKDFSLHVEPGQSIALVGLSGCGKSTVAKLISGLYDTWEGEILFDGKHREEIPHSVFTNSISMINQDIVLFEGSIADNIKMWDGSIEDFTMILASNDAQIHDEIASRDGAYNSEVIDGGKNFSGGQQQRIEIAAALSREPTILIMDEATSALDTETEEKVMGAIRALGITLIIVAHRLSTIRTCDRILVMKYGKVEQDGSHEELMKDENGLYYKLNNA